MSDELADLVIQGHWSGAYIVCLICGLDVVTIGESRVHLDEALAAARLHTCPAQANGVLQQITGHQP